MKLLSLSASLTFLLLSFNISFINAQAKEGYIIYEDKIDIHAQLPPGREAMKANIPQFRTSEKILYFQDKKSLYTEVPKTLAKEETQDFTERNRRRRGRMFSRNSKVFVDLNNNQSVEEQDLFGKKFLISGNFEEKPWKITGKTKQVGNFLCQEATYQDSTQSVVAWFSPMIPVSIGPEDFRGLPGAVLRVEIDGSNRVFTATKIITDPLAENTIVKPEDGEAITREEFVKLREEKRKEMRSQFGDRRRGGGGGGYRPRG